MAVACLVLFVGCTSATPTPTSTEAPSQTPQAPAGAVVNCGSSDLRPPSEYDSVALACVWNAYSARTPARWSVTRYTTGGAPIPETLRYEGGVILLTRDMTADPLSRQPDRRLLFWRCSTMTKRPYVSDSQKYFFDLAGCSGDGSATAFP